MVSPPAPTNIDVAAGVRGAAVISTSLTLVGEGGYEVLGTRSAPIGLNPIGREATAMLSQPID